MTPSIRYRGVGGAITMLLLFAVAIPLGALNTPDAELEADKIVVRLDILAGDSVAIAGSGILPLIDALSERVGAEGHVFVIETDRAVIEHLRRYTAEHNLANTLILLGDVREVRLPHTVRLLLLVNNVHHLREPRELFQSVHRFFRSDGTLAVIDYYRRPMRVGPPWKERVSSAQVIREVTEAGYRHIRRYHALPYHYFLIFRPK